MLAYTAQDGWEFGIGDPSFMGWLTVAGYSVAALLCWAAAMRARRMARPATGWTRTFVFWILCGWFLLILGINKQLDLQTWFTLFAKRIALEQGWYEQRRMYQALFIGGVALAGLAALGLMIWLGSGSRRQTRLALCGALFLGCFVLIRASSFHHVDQMLGFRLGAVKMNWLFELGGICCMAIGACRSGRASQQL